MASEPQKTSFSIPGRPATKVLVATTAMLAFISYWRAAAIVLNDLASSAYYAGGEAEQFIGKSAPWFILATMLLSYAVSQVYVESCGMFVRGGVYRVVKEAMGGALAKFSVSALMFDYVLTGPISGVSAGQYLAGLLNELFAYAHLNITLNPNATAAAFAIAVTVYFWWENIKGIPESSEKALWIMQLTTVMVVLLIGWCAYTLLVRGGHLPPAPIPRNIMQDKHSLGWLYGTRIPQMLTAVIVFVGLGHSVLAMSGEESLAQVYREIEHPKLVNLKKAALVIFLYSMVFTSLVSFFAVMIIPDNVRPRFFENLIGGLAMSLQGPFVLRAGVSRICSGRGHADPLRRGEHRHHRLERRAEPRFRRRRPLRLVPPPAPEVWHVPPHHQHDRGAADRHDRDQPRRRHLSGEPVRFRRDLEFCAEGHRRAGLALHAPAGARISRPAEFPDRRHGNPRWPRADHPDLALHCHREPFHQTRRHDLRDYLFRVAVYRLSSCRRNEFSASAARRTSNSINSISRRRPSSTPDAVGVQPGNILVPVSTYYALYHLEAALRRAKRREAEIVVLHVRLLRRRRLGRIRSRSRPAFQHHRATPFHESAFHRGKGRQARPARGRRGE